MGGLGAALVVSLFFGWYRACSAEGCESGPAASAWEAFAVTDVVLALAGLTALAALILTLVQRTPALPLALTSIGVFVALGAAILVLVALIAEPAVPGAGDASSARLGGAWVGTAAALGLLAAMLASIRDERTPAPPRTVEEQHAAVRKLTLSKPNAGARPDAPAAGPWEAR